MAMIGSNFCALTSRAAHKFGLNFDVYDSLTYSMGGHNKRLIVREKEKTISLDDDNKK
jgi:hypothetical protein